MFMPCNHDEIISAHPAQTLGLIKTFGQHRAESFDHHIGRRSSNHGINAGYINQVKEYDRVFGKPVELLDHGKSFCEIKTVVKSEFTFMESRILDEFLHSDTTF